MDERLEKALAFSNYRATIENRRKALRRRFDAMMVVHHNNGMFVSNQETIAFVDALLRGGHRDAVVIDTRMTPIHVADLQAFYVQLMENYFAATNEYAAESTKLSKARDVKKAMNW